MLRDFWPLMNGLKGVCHEIFHLYFCSDSNPSGPLINRVKYFRIRSWFRRDIRLQSSKCEVKMLGLANKKMFLQIFSFMIGVFTPKRISPDCPFKSNQRLTKILILTPRCAVWLPGVQFDSGVCILRNFITWLHGGMHTAELDLAVGFIPGSQE